MGVLFLMPQWSAPSELWLARMLDALAPHVVAIGAWKPTESHWRGRVPALALQDSRPALWRRVARRLHLPVANLPARTAADVLYDAVEDARVDVVFVQYLEFALQFRKVWERTTKRLVVHCHGYDATWDLRAHEQPDRRYHPADYEENVRWLSGRATIVANSHHTARRFEQIGVPAARVHVKYYGVPAPPSVPPRQPRVRGTEILYLGRLVDCKGPDRVIAAFERACAAGLDGRLVIAGDGPLRITCALLRGQSRWRDRIELLGAVDAPTGARLRAGADVFTAHNCLGPLTHQEEAFGVSIVEAMADGLPVVTGRSGGVVESVVDGATGYLVEPGDVDAHAAALLRLARDPALRGQMGRAAVERARAWFSPDQERAALLSILGISPPPAQAMSQPALAVACTAPEPTAEPAVHSACSVVHSNRFISTAGKRPP